MEQMAKEQDRETDKQAILSETQSHRKQMLRLDKHFFILQSFSLIMYWMSDLITAWSLLSSCLSNQMAWRKANLACKMAIDNLEKDELLQGDDSVRQR